MAPGTSPLTLSRDSLGPPDASGGNRCGGFANVPVAFGLESSYLSGSDMVVVENESRCSSGKGGRGLDECIVLKPGAITPQIPLIPAVDMEAGGNGLELNGVETRATRTNEPGGLTELMSSLNLNWDYVTQLQEKYLPDDHGGEESEDLSELSNNNVYASKIRPPPIPTFAPYYHPACPGSRHFRVPRRNQEQPLNIQLERKSSLDEPSSSAGGSDNEESTLKEIFGQVQYDEWMAPLASSETLSEISSLRSSRASFFLPKDQSPLLMRVRGGGGSRNGGTSSSLHRHNNKGRRGLACFFGGGGSASVKGSGLKRGHHNRSLSCTYPENTNVSIISFSAGLFGNGTKTCVLPPRIRASKKKVVGAEQNVACCKCATHESLDPRMMTIKLAGPIVVKNDNSVVGVMEESHIENDMSSSPSSVLCQGLSEKDGESIRESTIVELPCVDRRDGSQIVKMDEHDGEGVNVEGFGRASFSIEKMFASQEPGSSNVGDVSNGGGSEATAAAATYVPVYPTFSNQQEYGVPEYSHPHFNYPSETPPLSPAIVVDDDDASITFEMDKLQIEKTSNRPIEENESSVVLELDCIEQNAADDYDFEQEC